MRFHVLGIPHTITTPEYTTCAFTQKVVKLCKMLKDRGHDVIHYGHVDSVVECTENVGIIRRYDLQKSYGTHDWAKNGWAEFNVATDWAYRVFNTKTPLAIEERRQPGDILLCPFGLGHKPVADALPGMLVCESGIGYPQGAFAPYRVFESYAVLHAYAGREAVATQRNTMWYDAVIPNAFDPEDFVFQEEKDDYLLFLGRVNSAKGVHIAEQLAKETGRRLIVAGAGDFAFTLGAKVERIGVVGRLERAELLANASAVICASTFLEPFCGVQIEAMLSGTPVISSDWGAFAEYNVHGLTGYRCRTFEQFLWAVRNIGGIDAAACRKWGEKFTLENIAPMYTDYFQSVKDLFDGEGWYQKRPDRESLSTSVFVRT